MNPFSTRTLNSPFGGWFGRSRTWTDSFDPLPAAALFGAGLVVGAGVALLIAPKSGYELREDVARTASRLGNNVRERLPGTVGRNVQPGEA